jgi:hypothetical protein
VYNDSTVQERSFLRMKKTIIKIMALALVAVMVCAVLVSCGGPSGKYAGTVYTLEFKGSDVSVTWKGFLDTYTMTGTFELGEDEQGNRTISFTWPEGESYLQDAAYATAKSVFGKNVKYNEGSDDNGKYIEIAGFRFDQAK